MSKFEISKEKFEITPQLKAIYGSYENYRYQQLKTQSLYTYQKEIPAEIPVETFYDMRMADYDKHNKISEDLIAKYETLKALYEQAQKQSDALTADLFSKYNVSSNKDLTLAMKENNSLVDAGKFNVSANNVNATYQAFISTLQTANEHTHRIV